MTSNSEVPFIEERLIMLEKQNRTLRLAGVAIVLAFSALILMGQARSGGGRNVEAEKFVVKDRDGKVLAELSGTGLVVYDAKGDPRIKIGDQSINPPSAVLASPGMSLYDEIGERRVVLSTRGTNSDLKFEAGDRGMILTVNGSGPSLSLADEEGYHATIGSGAVMDRRTGTAEIVRTNTASVVLGKDSRVLWRAP